MNQRLLPLLLLVGLIVLSVVVLGPDRSDNATSSQTSLGSTPSAVDTTLEAAPLESTEGIPIPDPNLQFETSKVERSDLENTALIIDVVADELGATPRSFDIFLLDFDDQVTVLREHSEAVHLSNINHLKAVCARGPKGWSKMRPLSDRVEIDGIPQLQLKLEQVKVGFRLATSSQEGVSTAAAQLELETQDDVAQVLLFAEPNLASDSADGNGGFALHGLPPANYSAVLTLEDHAPVLLEIDLNKGSREDLEVEFVPAGALEGRVVFEGRGLESATVALLPSDALDRLFNFSLDDFLSVGEIPDAIPFFHQTSTDRQGNFRLSSATPGEYHVLVAAVNYLPLMVADAISIAARETTTCADLEVEIGFGISLMVVDSKAIPVDNVAVTWYRNAGSSLIEARRRRTVEKHHTNKAGRLQLGGLPAEHITLELTHPDFAQVVLKHDFSGRTQKAIDSLEVVLQTGATVAGSVVDGRTGMPIENAQLELHTSENSQGFGALLRGSDWDASSGQDGKFTFAHLPSGDYVLIAKHDDFAETTVDSIKVQDSAVEDITIMLHPGAALIVTVLDSEGVGIEGATVQAINGEAQQIKTGTTNSDGITHLENLTPGGYQVTFTDISSFDTDAGSGSLDVSFKFLNIKEGEELEVTLGGPVLSADVEGYVRLGGETIQNATVAIITNSGVKVDTSDETGAFKVEAVPLGDFILVVRSGLPTSGGSVFYDSIHIGSEGTLRHDIDMPNDGVKVLVLSASDRKPLGNIPVTIRPMDASNISGGDFGITDTEGIAKFPSLAPGDYIVAAGNAAASFMATSDAGFGSKQQSHVAVREGSGIQLIEMPLELGATYKVQVEDPDGNLLAGAHMHYLNAEGQALNILSFKGTNAKGVAQMTGLPSGPGIILVRHPTLGSKEIEVNLRAGSESKSKVRLEAGTVVYITSTDADGQPISGVLAAALDERGAPMSYLWSQEETQATNAAFFGLGEQKLGPLPDGDYIIQLYRPGKPPVRHPVSINGQRELHLRLPYSAE